MMTTSLARIPKNWESIYEQAISHIIPPVRYVVICHYYR